MILLEQFGDGSRQFIPMCTYFKARNAPFGTRLICFNEWWDKDIVFQEDDRSLTRKQLVFVIRNKDGGGHFDLELRNPSYISLQDSMAMFAPDNKKLSLLRGLEWATMRQIAEEVRLTFAIYGMEDPGLSIQIMALPK